MTGLQDAVQEWKNAPPASTLPQPLFASSSSARLEEGMRQMSETFLSDQESQGPVVRNTWEGLKQGETATTNFPWTEYWFNGEVYFGHPDVPTL